MKTEFQNTVKRTLSGILVATFVLISSSALKAQTSGSTLAMIIPAQELITSISEISAEGFAFVDEVVEEAPLMIENWMSDTEFWGTEESASLEVESLNIEPWMSSEVYWTGEYAPNYIEAENETPLALQSWMSSDNYWGTK